VAVPDEVVVEVEAFSINRGETYPVLPDAISSVTAAALPLAGLTALRS
jgi:hypothetical protein